MGKQRDLPEKYQRGFLVRMDGRQEITKRLQAAYDAIVADTGGADGQTHLRLALVERAVFLEFALQKWELELLAGKADDAAVGKWIQAVNSLLGLAKTLGLNRSRVESAIDALYGPADEPEPDENPTRTPDAAPNAADGNRRKKTPRSPRERLDAKEKSDE